MEKLTASRTVFVYGTLKQGFGNHPILGGSRFIGPAKLFQDHRMFSLGGFPGVILSDAPVPGPKVSGELYEVSDLDVMQRLDWLEGYDKDTDDGMYLRRPTIAVMDLDGSLVPCETYIWNGEIDELEEVSSREWR